MCIAVGTRGPFQSGFGLAGRKPASTLASWLIPTFIIFRRRHDQTRAAVTIAFEKSWGWEMSQRGALWRKWDLHIHTPVSFQWRGERLKKGNREQEAKLYKATVEAINACAADAVGIMDYWTFDGYVGLRTFLRENPDVRLDKAVFPGMEMRVEAPVPFRMNIHVLLSDELTDQELEDFKSKLTLVLLDRPLSDEGIMLTAEKMSPDKIKHILPEYDDRGDTANRRMAMGNETALITRESLEKAVASLPKGKVLVVVPFDTYGGLEKMDWKKHPLITTVFMGMAHLFEARSPNYHNLMLGRVTDDNERYIANFLMSMGGRRKPPVSGSDAHRHSDYAVFPKDQHGDERCTWIKADTTFRGILQLCNEPAHRVFIGPEPRKLKLVRERSTKYIRSLTVRKKLGSTLADHWFDVSLEFNHDLVAVVGNKGSGKSALVDILGLLGGSKNEADFSFLNGQKFRNPRMNISTHFEAKLTWESGDSVTRTLDTPTKVEEVERVKYLPQNYLEKICNEIKAGDNSGFDAELKSVIFSHVPQPDRLETETLDELLELKTKRAYETVEILKDQLHEINVQIVKLEKQATPEHKLSLEKQLEAKLNELRAHERSRPAEVAPPGDDPAADSLIAEIAAARADQQAADDTITAAKAEQRRLAVLHAKAQAAEQLLDNFKRQHDELVVKLDAELKPLGLKAADVVTVSIDKSRLVDADRQVRDSAKKVEASLDPATAGSPAAARGEAQTRIDTLQTKMEGPAKAFQEYQTKLAEWQLAHDKIEGKADEPNTISHLRAALDDLALLPGHLDGLRAERVAKAREIYAQIAALADTYRTVYQPVQDFTQKHKIINERFKLNFTVAIRPRNTLYDLFFGMVSHGVAGSFCGVDEGTKVFKELVARHDFSAEAGAIAFAEELLDHMTCDYRDQKRPPVVVGKQLKKNQPVESLYDFIFSFDYLLPQYTLSLDDKELSQLSPGERGTLLLIFYLLVDKDDIPFVVDQPEGNLDNHTVYKLLGECIREAKERRQIIMVTHNPNLAVACDAEQIICASIDPKDGHRVKYASGSIENPDINRTVLNVLEGTRPAFDNREAKYFADEIGY
jgi:ABC-type lipoprotein export system ATPase subunit